MIKAYLVAISCIAVMAQDLALFPELNRENAYCQFEVTVMSDCPTIYAKIKQAISIFTVMFEPGGGTMDRQEYFEGRSIWANRTSPINKYEQDVQFTVKGDASPSIQFQQCLIDARSRSRRESYFDKSVNFCNLFNVLDNTKI